MNILIEVIYEVIYFETPLHDKIILEVILKEYGVKVWA